MIFENLNPTSYQFHCQNKTCQLSILLGYVFLAINIGYK